MRRSEWPNSSDCMSPYPRAHSDCQVGEISHQLLAAPFIYNRGPEHLCNIGRIPENSTAGRLCRLRRVDTKTNETADIRDPEVSRVDRTRTHPATHPQTRGKDPKVQPPPGRRDGWDVHSRPRRQTRTRGEGDQNPQTKTQDQKPAPPPRRKRPERGRPPIGGQGLARSIPKACAWMTKSRF